MAEARDEEYVFVTEPVHPRDAARFRLPAAARQLMDALDRARTEQSVNVQEARSVLREILNTIEAGGADR